MRLRIGQTFIGKKIWRKRKKSIWRIKFGENVKILTIVVELQDVWQIKFGRFGKIRQTFVLYGT